MNVEDLLLRSFDDPRPRNIRKALKSGVKCYVSYNLEDFTFLYQVHRENIESIGGLPKKKDFFMSLANNMSRTYYKLYIADMAGHKISALLLLFYNKTVEYYTPATIIEYRNIQPLSLLIFRAMTDAINDGYKFWNWGGTWLTQDGVYNFKKKWGAKDFPYYYYTKVINKDILNLTKEELLQEYPGFYVVPYMHLKDNRIN
jgi:lipid II:glycine glycyltransferase (peptidoglycan interpeptide bridge formation enzyme)